jgi:archaellum component FlaC
MMAEADNLIPEHLRHMRGQLDRMEHRLEDVTLRLGHLERSVADHSVQLAEINTKLDRLDARVTRIEKRLDLVEG